MDVKTCSKCKTSKPIDRFNYSRPNVLRGNCQSCQNDYNKKYLKKNPEKVSQFALNRKGRSKEYRQETKKERNEYLKEWGRRNPEKRRAQKYRHRYGIDVDGYNSMLLARNGKCAICYSSDFGRANAKVFVVDHCHQTGTIRGLLCHKCNMVIGFSNDSKDLLLRAISYLED